MQKRKQTKVVKVGNTFIGGNNKIAIQSMTNTKTKDVKATATLSISLSLIILFITNHLQNLLLLDSFL